jgi:ABC-type cobalt transport system substrate-binding protein
MRSQTSRKRRWPIVLAPLIAIGCSASADENAGPDGKAAGPSYEIVGADYQPLRAAFQADSGKVRAILLGSPT